ncbi:MAG: 3-hydroxyacyl-CoA dehydrogenase NAD-binding domain-containing protein, partial [candidate division WOR-3 bacterium]|nr:3-hydroxyacyl-CoA dehydrogenase NAD-binding domain-containing protein [candidate division WOR-3 bacterium]
MEINKIGVIGAGTMGNGIAQVFAQAGYDVVMIDVEQKFIDNGIAIIKKSLTKMVEKTKITQEAMDKALSKIKTGLDISLVKDCQLVVEAVLEKVELKREIF